MSRSFPLRACLLLAFAGSCFGQDSPTLRDTTDWIAEKVNSIFLSYSIESAKSVERYEVTFTGCEMNFHKIYMWERGDSLRINHSVGTAQLALLSAPTLSGGPFNVQGIYGGPEEVWIVVLQSSASNNSAFSGQQYTERFSTTLKDEAPIRLAAQFSLQLPFNSKALAERVFKAFQHATRLCGGGKAKVEPF